MMMKSFTSTLLLVALIAVLASTTSAQTPSPTSAVATSTTTTATPAAGTASTTPAATRPASNYTGIPPGELSTLLGVIASYATGRSANPGFGATATPASAAASISLVSAPTSVLMGLGLVMTTIILTAVGTVGF